MSKKSGKKKETRTHTITITFQTKGGGFPLGEAVRFLRDELLDAYSKNGEYSMGYCGPYVERRYIRSEASTAIIPTEQQEQQEQEGENS